jgi:hypothetical protein
VQRRVVAQIVDNAEIEVERAHLEHDADPGQGRPRIAVDRNAKNTDAAVPRREQPRDQREQRALAGPVGSEQGREPPRLDLQRTRSRAVRVP